MLKKKLLCSFCILVFAICSSAQIHKEKTSSTKTIGAEDIKNLPFSRGVNNFLLQQNFGFSRTKPENSDNSTRGISLNLNYNRFIIDGVAVGADINISSLRTEISNVDVIRGTSSMFYGNAIYGHTFDNGFNLYGKASVGFGSSKVKYTNLPDSKDDLFGYKFEIGAPIRLYKDGYNYLTPYIRYDHLQQKDGGIKETDNRFSIGLQFENYSPCSGYRCDCKNDRVFSKNIYDQGRNFIRYTSFGDFGFGKSKSESGSFSQETDISGGSFNFEYGHYLSRDIALGAGLSWSGSSAGEGNNKSTSSDFSFMPVITLNAPTKNCFENLFLQAGYGFGFEKTKIGSNEFKDNTSGLSINIGFNHFFGKHIALTPLIGYEQKTFKNTDTQQKTRYSGFEIGFGCSLAW